MDILTLWMALVGLLFDPTTDLATDPPITDPTADPGRVKTPPGG